ncbi:molybdate ABC transporter substrate-binding protein [Nitrolancea hollandica]|nr:molybdate ABC transporter substrate-binding protein [Nitrolancea hollandica]
MDGKMPGMRWPQPGLGLNRSLHATLLAILTLVALLLAACGGTPTTTPDSSPSMAAPATSTAAGASPVAAAPTIDGTVTVFAAASLTDAFNEMGKALETANPGTKLAFNFAGSQKLRTQLQQGAKADVFASADEKQMQGAQEDGTIAGDPKIFVHNKLVVIVPAQNKAGINDLKDLTKPGIKLILAQKDVPVGNYSRQSFDKLSQDPAYGSDFATKVLANLVSEETNVKSVVSKVQLGEADAGIVYSSDVTPSVRDAVKIIDIPDQFNVLANYPIATVKDGQNASGGKAFIDYVLSPAGQETLKKWGFIPVSG